MPDLSSKIADFNDYFHSGAYNSARVILTEITHEFIQSLYPIAPPGESDPKYLIHYTSLDALFSMLDRKDPGYLRLYDTIYSNDPTEGVFFLNQTKLISGRLYSSLPQFIHDHNPGYAYIVSFVQANKKSARDKLKYWLAYGRNGHGCSIAIPYDDFSPELPMLHVQYGKSAVKKTAKKLVSLFNSFDSSVQSYFAPNSPVGEFPSPLAVLSAIPYFHKPSSYSTEAECRLFFSPLDRMCDPKYQLRYSPDSSPIVRHYVDHGSLCLRKVFFTGTVITLGPSIPQPENVQRSIYALLRHHDLTGPDVACSKIPYRPPSN